MAVCFLFLGWAFWELSGGSDFEPSVQASTIEAVEEVELEETVVARNAVQPVVSTQETVTLVSATPAPAATPAIATEVEKVVEAVVTAAPETATDIRKIDGDRVNMRKGPGTNFGVVTKLSRNTEVEILQEPGNGWLELRVIDNGNTGWIADWLVTADAS